MRRNEIGNFVEARHGSRREQMTKEKTMYTRILIPLDGSKAAEKVLP